MDTDRFEDNRGLLQQKEKERPELKTSFYIL
jgi:hypothetical protein